MVQVRRTGGNSFRERPEARIGRSQFNRSHSVKTTFDGGELVPILVDEVLPGDTFTLRMNGFCRIFSPLKSPIMDNIELETFFFFVPTRLVWDNWEAFNGAHDAAGAQDTDYTIPIIESGLTIDQSNSFDRLADYFGIPYGLVTGSNNQINSLPFRAYNLIYNEWFRDQNLIDELTVTTGNGPDSPATTIYQVRKRAKKHDMFTSALPYLQKGDDGTIPLTGTAPVTGIGVANQTWATGPVTSFETGVGSQSYLSYKNAASTDSNQRIFLEEGTDSNPNIYADLTGVSIDINVMRQSLAIQRLLEIDARGGTRYVELIKAHFGVTSPDFRLQRPEYLGGGKSYINVTPVAQTAEGTTNPNVGQLLGVGAGSLTSGHGFAKSFVEHGYIIGLVNARADVTYQQGLDKMWSKSTRYDFYVPALANLGEDAIRQRELYVSNTTADDNVFGYQERWYDYRNKKSHISGKFRSDATGSLDIWHLAEDFGTPPALSQTFVEDQTATVMGRVTAVPAEPDFVLDAFMDYKCARPLPVYSIPSLTTMRF